MGRHRYAVCRCLVHRIFFQRPDIDLIVDEVPAAPLLAGVLADHGTGRGKGVVLPHHGHCAGIILLCDQGNIAGDVHMGRAHGDAGDGLANLLLTHMPVDMADVLVAEFLQPLQDHLRRLIADGAVRRGMDHLRQLFHLL